MTAAQNGSISDELTVTKPARYTLWVRFLAISAENICETVLGLISLTTLD